MTMCEPVSLVHTHTRTGTHREGKGVEERALDGV